MTLEERIEAQRAECQRLRDLAHGAPRSIEGAFSNAWAQRSREWMAACDVLGALERERAHLSPKGEGA